MIDSAVPVANNNNTKQDEAETRYRAFRVKKGTPIASLRSLFIYIINDKQVSLNIKTIELIITNELFIKTTSLDPTIVKTLPYMLISYIRSWPGWVKKGEYEEGSLKLDEWFSKFHTYVTFKLKYLIQKGYKQATTELAEEKHSKGTQSSTEDFGNCRSFSPFTLKIEGPPKLLNTIIFSSHDDHISMKMHSIKTWLETFNIQHLMNWPFLEVSFHSDFLEFSRRTQPSYVRYLARPDDLLWRDETGRSVEVVVTEGVKGPDLSVLFLKQYLTAYVGALSKQGIEADKMTEIKVVLTELYRDIADLESTSEVKISDKTIVEFNMGGCQYIRRKKIASARKSNAVGLMEVVTPKCMLKMKKVDTGPDTNGQLALSMAPHFFSSKVTGSVELPTISYSCSYCKKQYGGVVALNAILKHYKEEHSMEHEILCYSCKKEFRIMDLSTNRWQHECGGSQSKKKGQSLLQLF